MTHAEYEKEYYQEQPARIIENGQNRKEANGECKNPFAFVAKDSIDDVSSVELANG